MFFSIKLIVNFSLLCCITIFPLSIHKNRHFQFLMTNQRLFCILHSIQHMFYDCCYGYDDFRSNDMDFFFFYIPINSGSLNIVVCLNVCGQQMYKINLLSFDRSPHNAVNHLLWLSCKFFWFLLVCICCGCCYNLQNIFFFADRVGSVVDLKLQVSIRGYFQNSSTTWNKSYFNYSDQQKLIYYFMFDEMTSQQSRYIY